MLQLIYCPYPTIDAAREAATGLLEARLVACCNLLAATESLYWWHGKIAATPETVLIAKTTENQLSAARAWLLASHPYETPALLSFPVQADADFALWVSGNVTNHY